jgi:hypothetical protein
MTGRSFCLSCVLFSKYASVQGLFISPCLCIFVLFVSGAYKGYFLFILAYSPTCFSVLFLLHCFLYYIFFRTRQYKQAGLTTVSIWRSESFWIRCYILYPIYSLIFRGTLCVKVFMLLPINSILCLRFHPLYISCVIYISHVIGWRAVETRVFIVAPFLISEF